VHSARSTRAAVPCGGTPDRSAAAADPLPQQRLLPAVGLSVAATAAIAATAAVDSTSVGSEDGSALEENRRLSMASRGIPRAKVQRGAAPGKDHAGIRKFHVCTVYSRSRQDPILYCSNPHAGLERRTRMSLSGQG
jgi:hypothetical protein